MTTAQKNQILHDLLAAVTVLGKKSFTELAEMVKSDWPNVTIDNDTTPQELLVFLVRREITRKLG